MECQRVQDEILESFAEARPPDVQAAVDDHLAGCPACARFAAAQKAIDASLVRALAPPRPGLGLRRAIRTRIHRQDAPVWSDWLPHVVHVVSCAGITIVCAALVPFDSSLVLAVGAIGTALTHFLLATVHGSLDAADDVGY
jgi:anti-sigma factor RsiW